MRKHPPVWRSPEEIVEIAFQRASVVIMNEAHNGWKRCIRTRQIGTRILPVAHQAGVRHLAMEALFPPILAEQWNATHRVPENATGYPSQPEMREFIQSALDMGWTLIPYEANPLQWLSARHTIQVSDSNDMGEIERILQSHQAEILSLKFTNWREEQQARNILQALKSLPERTPLLVWCGNSHQSKIPVSPGWIPMGYQFKKLSGIDPFVIDQALTVNFTGDEGRSEFVRQFSQELMKYGGTAGLLFEEAAVILRQRATADAFLLSTQNELE